MAEYFRGRGNVKIAPRLSSGLPGAFFDVGNVSLLSVGFEEEVVDHNETSSGNDLQDLRLFGAAKGNVNLTLEEHTTKNLLAFFRSATATIGNTSYASSNYNTATGITFAVGDFWQLTGRNISGVVIKDSAGSAATLVLGTDYAIADAKRGLIKILNLGAYTQPFRAQYAAGGAKAYTLLSEDAKEYYLSFAGKNTARSPFLDCSVELYRASFNLPATLELLSRETNVGQMELVGALLRDADKEADSTFGPFGRYIPDLDA